MTMGAAQGGAPTARFAAFVKEEIAKWGKVVRDGNITIDDERLLRIAGRAV